MFGPDLLNTNRGHPGGSEPERSVEARLEVFPVAIGMYDHHEQLDVDTEVAQVVQLLGEFDGGEVAWVTPMADRGADAVDSRLQAWARPQVPANSVLYWVGHGWSDGFDVALAHARSPATVRSSGLLPAQLAEPLRTRQATAAGLWAIVIVDTCWSSRFVDKVNAELADGVLGANAVLLVGVSGDGAASLGRFTTAFRGCLQENFRADRKIELWRLVHELDRRLPHGLITGRRLADAALERGFVPVAATLSLPLDVLRELEEIIARLPDDERRHFLLKAQGAEEGELCWFFEGRIHERAQIVNWLRATESGLLILTGRAGSGKSALLGHVLVHSLPDLRSVLARAGLVDPLPGNEVPPDSVFNEVIHLTGITLTRLVRRIALASGLGDLPSLADSATNEHGAAGDLDWLVEGLQKRLDPFTLLVDALDEADDPLTIARTVLRRIAAVPGVRVLVGTRASTKESPDHPEPDDYDLLEALGTHPSVSEAPLVWMARDDEAVVRYVIRRLTVARDRGALSIDGRPVGNDAISAVAEIIGRQQREFLFARLAVYEVLADPALLSPAQETTLIHLLAGDHRDLFATAVTRLANQAASFLPLLEALALARGRGIPVLDGIWAIMATALTDSPDDLTEFDVITDADISALLADAQPYIAVDFEAGQTVYRLAHRTFAEYFLARWEHS